MSTEPGKFLFGESVPSGATRYIPVPIRNGALGADFAWLDATSAGTLTLELSSYDEVSLTAAGTAWQWKDSGLTFTGPAGAAAGATLINIENVRQHLARLKFVASAASAIEVRDGT